MVTPLAWQPDIVKESFDAYVQKIDGMRLIEEDEQQQLFVQARKTYGGNAEKLLIVAHLRYVVNIARDYLKYDQQFDDLIQEGNIGLIKALRQFNPETGVKFMSVAIRLINLEICSFVLNNWCIVPADVTKEQLHLFMRMRRFKPSRASLSSSEVKNVASSLGVQLSEVLRLESRLQEEAISLDAIERIYEDSAVPRDYMIDKNDQVAAIEEINWSALRMNHLRVALESLDERSRDVIKRRWLGGGRKAAFREISKNYSVSGERIRQIQRRAFGIMRSIVP